MRFLFLTSIILFSLNISFSLDLGGALSIDYYNNPIEDSAPSPIQNRPVIFHSLSIGIFNVRSGIGITEGIYESIDSIPVFNDYYSGFYTVEFDLFTYPGVLFNITDKFALGLSIGGGVRLPLLTKIDDDVEDEDVINDTFNWFYSDLNFLFWGGQVITTIKLPLSSDTRFFGSINYTGFVTRDEQWIIGATIGLLWHI